MGMSKENELTVCIPYFNKASFLFNTGSIQNGVVNKKENGR